MGEWVEWWCWCWEFRLVGVDLTCVPFGGIGWSIDQSRWSFPCLNEYKCMCIYIHAQEDRVNLREEYLEERKALERKYGELYE